MELFQLVPLALIVGGLAGLGLAGRTMWGSGGDP